MRRRVARTALVCLLGGCSTAAISETGSDVVVNQVDTLVASGDGRFDRLSDIVAGPRGELFVVDANASTIVQVGSDGTIGLPIGGAGGGPGELQHPRSVFIGLDTIRVVDEGNGRIARFTRDGRGAGTTPLPPAWFSGAVSFGEDGSAVVSGASGPMLVRRYDPTGSVVDSFAPQVVPAPGVWDFGAIKQTIAGGEVPANMRNLVLPVLASDGYAWLAYHTEGVLERYDARDSLVARAEIEVPEVAAIRANFFRRNREMPANQLFTLSEFAKGQAVGDRLWLLLRQPEDSASMLLVIGPGARVESRIRIPAVTGALAFAVSPADRRLYLLVVGEGAVYGVTLPAALFDGSSVD